MRGGRRAEGDNEGDGDGAGGGPGRGLARASYLFKRRPPPAASRSRGLTRRVVSEPPAAGAGSMSPRPDRPGPAEGGEAGRPAPSPSAPRPRALRGAAGPPEGRELRRLWRGESELRLPRPRQPRPAWGELPKPRLRAPRLPPQASAPPRSPTPRCGAPGPAPEPEGAGGGREPSARPRRVQRRLISIAPPLSLSPAQTPPTDPRPLAGWGGGCLLDQPSSR